MNKELASALDNLHKKYDFQKIQEILGVDMDEGLKILETERLFLRKMTIDN